MKGPRSKFYDGSSLCPIEALGSGRKIARYGDGEWLCIFGAKGRNLDKCDFRMAGPHLRQCLKAKDDVECTMQPHAWRTMKGKIVQWLHREAPHRSVWKNADFMCNMVKRRQVAKFTKKLKDFRVLMAGPKHHESLGLHQTYVVVPRRNAIQQADAVLETIQSKLDHDVILLSCGYLATWLVHRIDSDATIIDCGSVWDPFAGVASRGLWGNLIKKGRLPPLRG